jgi:hypothetical protein
LFEKFKELDDNFQLIPGVDGDVLFIPIRNPAFLVGKAFQNIDAEIDFPSALKESVTD